MYTTSQTSLSISSTIYDVSFQAELTPKFIFKSYFKKPVKDKFRFSIWNYDLISI